MRKAGPVLVAVSLAGTSYLLRGEPLIASNLGILCEAGILAALAWRARNGLATRSDAMFGVAAGSVLFADIIYALIYSTPGHESKTAAMVAEFSYTIFLAGLVLFVGARYFSKIREGASWVLAGITVLFYGWLNLKFILVPFVLRAPLPSNFNLINSTFYSAGGVALVAMLIPCLLRVNDFKNQVFLQSILFLNVVDFFLRYQAAFDSPSSGSWLLYGWQGCMAVLLIGVVFWGQEVLSGDFDTIPFRSVRTAFAGAVLGSFALFAVALHVFGFYKVENAVFSANIMAVSFAIWFAANLAGLKISRDLLEVDTLPFFRLELQDSASPKSLPRLKMIGRLSRVYEFDYLIGAYNRLASNSNRLLDKFIERERQANLGEMAAQVAHDIRSPLMALQALGDLLEGASPKNLRLFRTSVSRIREIADNLVERGRASAATRKMEEAPADDPDAKVLTPRLRACHLAAFLKSVRAEKRLEFKNREGLEIAITGAESCSDAFAEVDASGLRRVLSNLVNNAVESIVDEGRVAISLVPEKTHVSIAVQDNGGGIPEEMLPKLMKKHATFGKERGTGLGLFNAKKVVEAFGGDITIRSTVGVGTKVTMRLPRTPPPAWFVSKIKVPVSRSIVVFDNEEAVFDAWTARFDISSDSGERLRARFFRTFKELKEVLEKNPALRESLFLVDYEIAKEGKNGLEIVEELDIRDRSILVTGNSDNESVQRGCLSAGVRLLPKDFLPFIRIEMPGHPRDFDGVLVTADEEVESVWLKSADSAGKELICFGSGPKLLSEIDEIATHCAVFIDASSFGEGQGEGLVSNLRARGFKDVRMLPKSRSGRMNPAWI